MHGGVSALPKPLIQMAFTKEADPAAPGYQAEQARPKGAKAGGIG